MSENENSDKRLLSAREDIRARIEKMNEVLGQAEVERINLKVDPEAFSEYEALAAKLDVSPVELMELAIFEMDPEKLKEIAGEFVAKKEKEN